MHRPVGPACNSGVLHRMAESSSSRAQSSLSPFLSRRDRVSEERNKTNAREASNFFGRTPLGDSGFPIKHFSSAEERRRSQAYYQSEKIKRVYTPQSLQDGGNPYAERPLATGGLHGENRPEGSLLCSPISGEDRKYLRFRWVKKTFQFNYLPFGLSCAPWVFTKITVSVLRELGIRLIIYIDDILVMAKSETLLRDHVAGIIYLLENLGFVINLKIATRTDEGHRLSRIPIGLDQYGAQTPGGQNKGPPTRGKDDLCSRPNPLPEMAYGAADIHMFVLYKPL